MKRILPLFAILLMHGLELYSQKISFSLSGDLPQFTAPSKQMPTAIGFGVNTQLNYHLTKVVGVSAGAGFIRYMELKENKKTGGVENKHQYNIVPVLGGMRFVILDKFVLQNFVGYSFAKNVGKVTTTITSPKNQQAISTQVTSEKTKGVLTWSPSVGWKMNKNWEALANLIYFNLGPKDSTTETATNVIVTKTRHNVNPFSIGLRITYNF